MIKPLGLMLHAIWRLIEFAIAPFAQPSACLVNLQAASNEVSLPRDAGGPGRQDPSGGSDRSESQHQSADPNRGGVSADRYGGAATNSRVDRDRKRLRGEVTRTERAGRTRQRDETNK